MRKILTSSLITAILFVFSVQSVSAKMITNEKGTVNITKTEVIDDDLFVGAQTVEIDGTINGDVFVGANTVKINGIINGNLHVGASLLILEGTVKGNVYVGAQNVLISNSAIGGSLLVGASTVNIDKDSTIGGSILAGAGTLSINSQIKRSVYAGTGSLTIGSDTIIGKDLYYTSGKEEGQINISKDAKIIGSIYQSEVNISQKNIDNKEKSLSIFGSAKIVFSIISFAGALIVGFLYLKLFGKHLHESANLVSKSFWKSLGVGFVATIAFIPGVILLIVTVVGIPLAGIAFLMLLLYSYLAKIVVGMALGSWISKKYNWKMPVFGAFALGLFAIYLIKIIPFIGFLTGLVVLWLDLVLTLRMFSKSD